MAMHQAPHSNATNSKTVAASEHRPMLSPANPQLADVPAASAEPDDSRLVANAVVGGLIWLICCAYLRPSLFSMPWAEFILCLAALVQVPLALKLIWASPCNTSQIALLRKWTIRLHLPAALSLLAAFQFPMGLTAAGLALPWLGVTMLIAAQGLLNLWNRRWAHNAGNHPQQTCWDIGCVYIIIGGGFSVISRMGLQPLGYDKIIVLLTAVHFHYAGLLLPSLAGLVIDNLRRPFAIALMLITLAAIPAVAVGMTAAHLGFSSVPEWVAATLMSLAGMLTACAQLRLATMACQQWASRVLWLLSSTCFLLAMLLAATFGLRATGVVPKLDVFWMLGTHGTMMALGAIPSSLLAWLLADRV